MTQFSRYWQNKLIPNFKAILRLHLHACFCFIILLHRHCAWYWLCWQFGDYFAKQICKKYFVHKHYVPKGFYWCQNLNFVEGMRLSITKWPSIHSPHLFVNIKQSFCWSVISENVTQHIERYQLSSPTGSHLAFKEYQVSLW